MHTSQIYHLLDSIIQITKIFSLIMTDKFKPNFNLISPKNTLRTSFQPSTSPKIQNINLFNNNINSESNTHLPPEVNMVSPKSKNFTNDIKQLENKLEAVYSQIKKQDASSVKPTTEINQLRSSMTNHTKKIEKDYFRKTTFNSKPYNIFNQKSNTTSESQLPFNFQTQPKLSSPNSNSTQLFIKKNNEITNAQYERILDSQINLQKSKSNQNVMFKPNTALSSYQSDYYHISSKKSHVICGFYIGKSLGAGKFGEVYLAKHINSGFICALKKINKQKVKEQNMIQQAIREIKILFSLQHPNIVQCYGFVNDQQNIYIILEYMEGGTLFDYLNKKQYLQESEAVVYMRQIAQAVIFLHQKDIIHRDIKPENIVISYNLAKLCDFGWATNISGSNKTYCGTFDYAAPQILQHKQYDESVDIWCLGILAYQLLVGKAPFEHKDRKIVMQRILNVDKEKIIFPENVSKIARDFIENIVKKNPKERLKSNKVLEHPFMKRKQQ